MKKIILFAILLLSSLAVNAQQTTSDARERLVEAKTRYMIRTLAITPAQQQRFTEIYRQYNKSMRGMWTNDNSSNGNDVNAQAQLIKQRLSKQKRAIDIQMATIDELAQVLNADQLSRFLDTERKIQQRIKARREQVSASITGKH